MIYHSKRRCNPVLSLAIFALVVGLVGVACDRPVATAELAAVAPAAAADPVARGEYLVTVAVCSDCHTPMIMGPKGPEPDMTRLLSGHPEGLEVPAGMPSIPAGAGLWLWAPHNTVFVSPLGTAYAMNLTPDQNTGIGTWSEETFVKTLRSGRHWGVARPIMPPMPWPYYGKMTDEDLKAIYAYLRTIPPVQNHVPDAIVAPPPSASPVSGR